MWYIENNYKKKEYCRNSITVHKYPLLIISNNRDAGQRTIV